MHYVYILQSRKEGKLYTGFTSDLVQRVKNHNSGRVKSTKNRTPFDLIYYEAYLSESNARERERQLKKRGGAFSGLKRRIRKSLQ